MPTTFSESDLEFTFSERWQVKAYDDHPFYKTLAGHHLKGVDFIGILDNEKVVLIEVKNYKIRFANQFPSIAEKIMGDTPSIVQTLHRKATDTRRALRIIRKYYQRQWWIKPFSFLVGFLPIKQQLKTEWRFWLFVEEKVATGDFQLLLWMELEEEYPDFSKKELKIAREKVLWQMQNKLVNVTSDVLLINRNNNIFMDSLKVEFDID